ncbi:hypothetical protein BYT27DRAFT_7082723 [Phlegmacium glaucopus]|nr:hypothetical protein BYT27DRAFT_7082723 [Phlegmacium glaucopus]
MLDFAVEHWEALDLITGNQKMKLRQYELSEEDWKIAIKLCDVLKIFKDATLFFSRGTPNITTVIPAMDHIDEHLVTAALSPIYPVAIKAALAIGKATLNRYYHKTDHSEVFWIAMVLHPQHKLNYFKKAGWEEAWVERSEDLVHTEFERSYKYSGDDIWASGDPSMVC